MTVTDPPADVPLTPDGHVVPEQEDEHPVSVLELFFDLVFVLGFTQCTALMSADPSWAGLGRGLQLELPGHAHLHLRGAAVCGSSR